LRAPNDAYRNEIDYIITDKRRVITDVSIISKSAVSVHSDHRLVRADIRIDFRTERRIQKRNIYSRRPKQFSVDLFLQVVECKNWEITDNNIDADCDLFLDKLNECKAAAEVNVVKHTKNRLSQATLDLIGKRREMASKGDVGLEYKLLSKVIRRRMTEDYGRYRKNKLRNAVEQKTSLKKAW
uniref:Endo/exonuclease/phosphatase domain-containing protein n=1 Tax=Gongylonema pulchrum TaxID=637853 RepID=A0A183DLQ1_9BILA